MTQAITTAIPLSLQLDEMFNTKPAFAAGANIPLTQQAAPDLLDLDDLDSMIADVAIRKADAVKIKHARKLLASEHAQLDAPSRQHLEKMIWDFEVTREWLPVASTLLVDEITCDTCRKHYHITEGVYQRQIARSNSKIDRLIKVKDLEANRDLPKEITYRYSSVALCLDCACKEGWDL